MSETSWSSENRHKHKEATSSNQPLNVSSPQIAIEPNLGESGGDYECDDDSGEFHEISTSEEEKLRRSALPLRDKLFKSLNRISYNSFAKVYAGVNFTCILASTLTFLISTMPYYHGNESGVLEFIEGIVVFVFTGDYIARLILTREHRLKFALQYLNLIDLLAILPFYIEIIIAQSSGVSVGALVVLRVLRLFRVFRVIKMAKYSKQLPVVINATKKSGAGFGMALFSMSLFVILWASGMYYAETASCTFDNNAQLWKYDDGVISPYQSIPHSLWWTIVTMTTVGYGDNVPVTVAGKIVASGAMLCGIIVLAFPLTILAGNFAAEYSAHLVAEEIKELKKLQKQEQYQRKNASPKQILKKIWFEMLTLKGGLDTTKETIDAFDRQFGKIELFVHKLERQMTLENNSLFFNRKNMKKKLKETKIQVD